MADYVRSSQTEETTRLNCGLLLDMTNSLFPDDMQRDAWRVLMPGGRADWEELTPQRLQHISTLNLVADRIAGRHPKMASRWIHRLSISHEMIGTVFEKHGDFPQALIEFEKTYKLFKNLTRRHPKNKKWLSSLSRVILSISRISNLLGRPESSRLHESLPIMKQLVGRDKRQKRVRGHSGTTPSATARERVVITPESAAASLRTAVQRWEIFLAENPRLRDIASLENTQTLEELARTYRLAGDCKKENEALRRLFELDPMNATWRYDLADSHRRSGDALKERSSGSMALGEYSSARNLLRGLVAEDSKYVQWQRSLYEVCWEMASLTSGRESIGFLEEGLQIIERLGRDGRIAPVERDGGILKFELKLGRLPLGEILKKIAATSS
ncbi:MAG TPA: hypothetical protein VGG06_01585 [Thermoanaerobaculia bacterium]